MDKALVLVTAMVFFLYGLIFMLLPEQALVFVVQGQINSSSGVIDLRATYGGMSVGVGMILFLLAINKDTLKIGLWSVVILMSGMAIGRVIGMVLDGAPNLFMYIYLVLELVAIMLALLVLRLKSSNKGI